MISDRLIALVFTGKKRNSLVHFNAVTTSGNFLCLIKQLQQPQKQFRVLTNGCDTKTGTVSV